MLPNMVDKTKEICVIFTFASYIICRCSFDLWVFHAGFDTSTIVVNFINTYWELCHVTLGIFEVHNISSVAMAK
jgi:hypothetical protein